MDSTFLTGMGAVVSAVIVFCGSVWLVLSMVTGARLAYFVTASITLAFVLIMGVVWSFTPLGPVGQLPEFDEVDIGAEGQVEFGQAGAYPGEPWQVPDEEDQEQTTKASEAESSATDILETAITEGEIEVFESADAAQAQADSTRLLEQDGEEYAAVLLEPVPEAGGGTEPADPNPDPQAEGTVLVVMQYDPGNPQGLARLITFGTLVLFVLHLFGLSRAEAKARQLREQTV